MKYRQINFEIFKRFNEIFALSFQYSPILAVFRLGYSWYYKDEKTFVECLNMYRAADASSNNRTEIILKSICE